MPKGMGYSTGRKGKGRVGKRMTKKKKKGY